MLGTGGQLPLRWELVWGRAPVEVAGASKWPAGVAGAVRRALGPRPGGTPGTAVWVAAAITGGRP